MISLFKKEKRVPLYFVIFFIILIIVNIIFLIIATKTHTGVVTGQSYEKGLKYNKTITASEKQDNLGWTGDINYENKILSFSLKDNKQNKVLDANVTANIYRPIQADYDFLVELEEKTKGEYKKEIDFLLQGQWDIIIVVKWKNHHYQQKKRIIIK